MARGLEARRGVLAACEATAGKGKGDGAPASGGDLLILHLLTGKPPPLSSFPSPRFLDLASSGGTGGGGGVEDATGCG